ncbi:MAG: DUF692 domain-containing protein [Proteobacteria bacterium]|nr:DUF692 domain-containing protein [Pseudomonadota bacterium]
MTPHQTIADVVNRRAGIGLRAPHYAAVLADRPAVGWLEIHPENVLIGGSALATVEALRADYPISLHAVGLSLGSADGIDRRHLRRLGALVARLEPVLVSDHLSWSTMGGAFLNDLLPLPLTEESLALVSRHVDHVQEALRRPLLVENPSSYLAFTQSTLSEPEFLAALVARTGCRLLCDVNNVQVSAHNLGFDPVAYLKALPRDAVAEIHLAGHSRNRADGAEVLIDDHGSPVADPVWSLYRRALARFGHVPTLIEWDSNIPELPVLCAEAAKADRVARPAPREIVDAA